MADAPAANVEEQLDELMSELQVKKSKKPKSKKTEEDKGGDAAPASAVRDESSLREDKQTYAVLLGRVYDQLRANNPKLVGIKAPAIMRPPQVTRVGTSRILWQNFDEICRIMKRDPDHVFRYFLTELGTTGSIDAKQQFVMKGKFVPKYVESVLKRYIAEYVTCSMCRGVDTRLDRDSMTRMNFLTCETCGSSRSVQAISKGYHAVAKGERRAVRNKDP